jgi:hypothetical protein
MASHQTHDTVIARFAAAAAQAAFDTQKYIGMLDATAAALVDQNPGLGANYPIWVVPSGVYPEMYSRDSFWTLAGYWQKDFLSDYVMMFSRNAQGAGWSPPLNGEIPRFVRKNVPAPSDGRPTDESTLFWIIGAKLAGRTVATEPYLTQAHSWLKALVTPQGLAMVSHGWIDAWFPTSSAVVSANNQGLFAVALRALRDMGETVSPDEIKAADDAYRGLASGGYLHAYLGSGAVDVSSLMGEALALYLWDDSILDDATVAGTVAKLAPTYYPDGDFLGFKCLSNPDGSYLDPSQFLSYANPDAGDYQNGGTWLLYDALALYAAARHDTTDGSVLASRLIARLKSEVKYEYSSKEFLCSGGTCNSCTPTRCTCPGGACGPGSFDPARSGYGWNVFLKRLLLNREPFTNNSGGHVNGTHP